MKQWNAEILKVESWKMKYGSWKYEMMRNAALINDVWTHGNMKY